MITGKSNWDIDVFVDEKWFKKLVIRNYLCLPERATVEDASGHLRHKIHVRKVMDFPAVAKPVAEFNFDGRIVVTPLLKEVKAKKNSSGCPADTSCFNLLPSNDFSLARQ